MTASTSEKSSPSRRALLAGALGGIGAFVASAAGASRVRGGVDGDVVLGAENNATTQTAIRNTTNANEVFVAHSTDGGVGVHGASSSSYGVFGVSSTSYGVYGYSDSSAGVYGFNATSSQPCILGQSTFHGTGMQGVSGTSVPPAKPYTGVFGYSSQSTSSRGVWGESTGGIGLYGRATTGFAGYFQGKVSLSSFQEMIEVATPAAPGANRARLFVRDNGAGKTLLCVRFATGSVKLLAQEA